MGKNTRRPRTSGDVSAMDFTQSSLGIRTRARNTALLQSSSAVDASPNPSNPDFLELRSRRLEKPPYLQNSRKAPAPKQGIVRGDREIPRIEVSTEGACSGSLYSVGREKDGVVRGFSSGVADSETEVSFGENDFDMEVRERTTREITPCSLIRTTDTITMPGSLTKQRTPGPGATLPRFQGILRSIPSTDEMEEFFALMEQPKQRHFIEKYNFDIVNDMPLAGRLEWVRM